MTTEVTSGAPTRSILGNADAFGADLIVLASHGYGVDERFLLGSVSQGVALHARCSVEIARRPKPRMADTNELLGGAPRTEAAIESSSPELEERQLASRQTGRCAPPGLTPSRVLKNVF